MRLTAISTAVLAAFASVALSAPAPTPTTALTPTDGSDTQLTSPHKPGVPGQEPAEETLVGHHSDRLAIGETTAETPAWTSTAGGTEEQARREEHHNQKEARMVEKRGPALDCLNCILIQLMLFTPGAPKTGGRMRAANECYIQQGVCTQAAIDAVKNSAKGVAARAGRIWESGDYDYDLFSSFTWG
ncbi:hypothetical protein ACKAV7_008447 [Fusarium commune]